MRTTFHFLFVGVMLSSVVAIANCRELLAKTPFQQGEEALTKDDFNAAVSSFTEAIRLDPKDAQAHYMRAVASRP